MLYYIRIIDMMTITRGLRTIHHRDTERTEDAQRKKNESLKLGSNTFYIIFKL
jgi:hypothetical protein